MDYEEQSRAVAGKWKATPFLIAITEGKPFEVRGHIYRGIGLHRESGGTWVATHLASGHAAARIEAGQAEAMVIATEIAEAADWPNLDKERWRETDPDLGQRIRAALAKHKVLVAVGKDQALMHSEGGEA